MVTIWVCRTSKTRRRSVADKLSCAWKWPGRCRCTSIGIACWKWRANGTRWRTSWKPSKRNRPPSVVRIGAADAGRAVQHALLRPHVVPAVAGDERQRPRSSGSAIVPHWQAFNPETLAILKCGFHGGVRRFPQHGGVTAGDCFRERQQQTVEQRNQARGQNAHDLRTGSRRGLDDDYRRARRRFPYRALMLGPPPRAEPHGTVWSDPSEGSR